MDKKNNRKKLLEKILKDRRIRQDITRRDFEWFFLTYFARHFRYETPPFHQEMFRILQDDSIDLAVFTAFRGSDKNPRSASLAMSSKCPSGVSGRTSL